MRDAGEWEKCFQPGAVKAGRRAGGLCGGRCFAAGYLMKNKEMIVEWEVYSLKKCSCDGAAA